MLFEISFAGETFEDVRRMMQEYAHKHLNMQIRGATRSPEDLFIKRGRPKMTTLEHLGFTVRGEVERLFIMVKNRFGEDSCHEILRKFEIKQLSELLEKDYDGFISECQRRLKHE